MLCLLGLPARAVTVQISQFLQSYERASSVAAIGLACCVLQAVIVRERRLFCGGFQFVADGAAQ